MAFVPETINAKRGSVPEGLALVAYAIEPPCFMAIHRIPHCFFSGKCLPVELILLVLAFFAKF
ncbi:hypothetical protein [Planctopirus hydrillae]|uniref:hypothetical protein n=1 Tax=Planctopirus hydrillae TaxID=1841610 RepID=UPI0010427AFF|nr:hypothetical protein [Planctopirus hydrillae]